ncbi:putative short-chain dehydrogenase/reductase family 42E member 2 isoform X2 [Anolis carolinensis]|uniref:putative short-chain dehydrogenase/reductase family 42E member 2 isoform X2 n=1 Tax=Anolis carolinensis TaxID=28377 RepID=UPI002F2B67BD
MEKPPHKDRKPHTCCKQSCKQSPKSVEQKPGNSQPALKRVSDKTVITGGAGYFGITLGRALAKSGTEVILYDIKPCQWEIPKGVQVVQADVRVFRDFYAACEGADCVIHSAAYGMSGAEQLHRKEIQSINIGGTEVVLEGQTIVDGDEASVTYFPLDKHVNEYSRTKAIAEQMVLAANGSPLAGGGKLYTCSLRSPGIYGPEEERHLPRLALNIERGFFAFRVGDSQTLMNWVHVKNLVQAHILATAALTPERNYIASGQVYFINDNEKVNLFEWLSPLFERLGVRKPSISVPVFLVHLSAMFMESVYYLLYPFVEITPPITRNEVHNISCTHTFKIDKARAELGYSPKKYSFADCVDHYLRKRPARRRDFFLLKCFLLTLLLMSLVIALIRFPDILKVLLQLRDAYVGILQ